MDKAFTKNIPVLSISDPIISDVYAAAVENLTQINTVDCPFETYNRTGLLNPDVPFMIKAGGAYDTPWTRDASVNSWNCASIIMPSVAQNTLFAVCEKNESGALSVQLDRESWDKAIWAVGAYNHYLVTQDVEFLKSAYEIIINTLDYLQTNNYNAECGLYMGGSFFNDGISAYPFDLREDGVESSHVTHHKPTHGICCLSTNCIYFKTFVVAAEMARVLGNQTAMLAFCYQADTLRAAINRTFWNEEKGMYSYLRYPDGRLDHSQEGCGNLFAILFDVCDSARAQIIMKNLKTYPHGIPSIYEPFAGFSSEEFPARHNNTIWPKINGWYIQAASKTGRLDLLERELNTFTSLVEQSDFHFFEIYNAYNGTPDGGWQDGRNWPPYHDQTWSATAYIAALLYGVFGMHIEEDVIYFKPCLPESLADATIDNLVIGTQHIRIALKGWGNTVDRIVLNGSEVSAPVLDREAGDADLVIYLNNIPV